MKKLLTLFTLLLSPLALSALNMDEWTSTDIVYDQNGNVTELLDGESGDVIGEYAYDPYGNLTKIKGEAAFENKVRFSTKEVDGSGNYYYGYRYYNPQDGRWLNRDPLGDWDFLSKTVENYQNLEEKAEIAYLLIDQSNQNLYSFNENRTPNSWDLLGLFSIPNPCKASGCCSKLGCRACCVVSGIIAGNICGAISNAWGKLACQIAVGLASLSCNADCGGCPRP